MSNEAATIVLNNGQSIAGMSTFLTRDSIYIERPGGSRLSVNVHEIQSVEHSNYAAGGLQGIFLGILGGEALGIGSAILISRLSSSGDVQLGAWWCIWLGGIVGGATGLTYGAIHGSTDVYILVSDSTNSSSFEPHR